MLVLKFIFAPIFRGNTLHNPGGWTNHCSFKLHNCKSSNLCCCSTHFSYKWEQLGGKIISHVTLFKFFFFAKDHNTYNVCTYMNSAKDLLLAKSKRVIDCHAGHFLKKKSWVTCKLINIKLEISIIWVNPKSLQQFHFNLEF